MKNPVIIAVPHAQTEIKKNFRNRIALSDRAIWKMSDPFTEKTSFYSRAFAIHVAKNHRILGDLDRDRTAADIFREMDFYGRKIWKSKKNLSTDEKEELLKFFWDPFRRGILESFEAAEKAGFRKILFIDHHNTAVDHPANRGEYSSPIVIGNFGAPETAEYIDAELSATPEIVRAFCTALEDQFPELSVECNKVYRGSSIVRFVRDEIRPKFPDLEIHAIVLEYNLNFIFNPLTEKIDDDAKTKFQSGFSAAIDAVVREFF